MLAPCPRCARHVRVDDATCPFCSVALPVERNVAPTRTLPIGKLTRAAVFFGGATLAAGCGPMNAAYGGPPPEPPPTVQPYGAPPNPPPEPPPPTQQTPPDSVPIAQPYGVPVQPEPEPEPPPPQQIVPPSGVQMYGAPPAPPPTPGGGYGS